MANIAPQLMPIQPQAATSSSSTSTNSTAEDGSETSFDKVLESTSSNDQTSTPEEHSQQTAESSETSQSHPHQGTTSETATDKTENQHRFAARFASQQGEQSPFMARFTQLGNHLGQNQLLANGGTDYLSKATTGESLISNQLQQLIESNEVGVLSISRKPVARAALNNLQNLNPIQDAAATLRSQLMAGNNGTLVASVSQSVDDFGVELPEKGITDRLGPIRQDVNGQFIKAKLEPQSTATNNDNQQATTGQNGSSANQSLLSAQASSSAQTGSETQTSFTQVEQSILSTSPTQATQSSPQPTILPPGSPIPESAIMHQVMDKFNIMARNKETRLNLQLHPAELGQLKIDLTFKEGAIRAHVVAQTQQVQEVLEKNMSRLREVLEDQGLQIEELTVSSQAGNDSDFNLFEEQLAGRNPEEQFTGKAVKQSGFTETLDQIVTSAEISESGVNVTI